MGQCSIDGCVRPVTARGLCNTHYMQQRRAGLLPIGTRSRGSLEERFWRFVAKGPGCWEWQGGSKSQKGYGLIQQGGKGTPRVLAHRLSYQIHHGPIEPGMVIMHLCDNPRCVNPAHLKQGTASENILDSFRKGRKVCIPPLNHGETHRSARLTEADVRFIRDNPQIAAADLALRFDLNSSSIRKVRRRETWKHVA